MTDEEAKALEAQIAAGLEAHKTHQGALRLDPDGFHRCPQCVHREPAAADPLAYLHATLDAARKRAEAAAQRAWSPHWEYDHFVREIQDLNNGNTLANIYFPEIAAHIEANDPAATLLRIEADLKLIADLTADQHNADHEDPWHSCSTITDGDAACLDDTRRGKPCDCGRDSRVQRRIRLIAEGWGWTEKVGP